MSGILFITIAGSLTGMALAAVTQDPLPFGSALAGYMLGGLFGMMVASTLPMLRKID